MGAGLAELLHLQSGVVSRRQVLSFGAAEHDIRRLVRRRDLTSVYEGVYVDHTGPLTWRQQAWAAVLFAWPSALSHQSALRAADGPGRRDRDDAGPIHVAIDRKRNVVAQPGIVVHHLAHIDERVLWIAGPPRVRIEEAVLDCAAGASGDLAAIAVLADAVQSRRTTAARLLAVLDERSRIAHRALLEGVLRDVAAGTCSVLEHCYLTHVERAHGLPHGTRQLAAGAAGSVVLRDVDYAGAGLVVELDGRLFHDSARARDADLERDLDARLVDHRETVRLGWGQVFDRPCATAWKVAALLQRRGWTGQSHPCPSCPTAIAPRIAATG